MLVIECERYFKILLKRSLVELTSFDGDVLGAAVGLVEGD